MVSVLNWTRKSNVDWPMPTLEVLMQPMTNCTMTLLFLKDPGSICRGYFGHSNEVYISMDKHSISIDRISLWIHYIWPLLKLVAPIVLLRHIADMSCGKWGRLDHQASAIDWCFPSVLQQSAAPLAVQKQLVEGMQLSECICHITM